MMPVVPFSPAQMGLKFCKAAAAEITRIADRNRCTSFADKRLVEASAIPQNSIIHHRVPYPVIDSNVVLVAGSSWSVRHNIGPVRETSPEVSRRGRNLAG